MFKVQKGKKEEKREGEEGREKTRILYPVKVSFHTEEKRHFHTNENQEWLLSATQKIPREVLRARGK